MRGEGDTFGERERDARLCARPVKKRDSDAVQVAQITGIVRESVSLLERGPERDTSLCIEPQRDVAAIREAKLMRDRSFCVCIQDS